MNAYRSGLVTIVGRPNVGKSTLLNRLVGQKLSITSRRPQTTRHRILGIRTDEQGQTVYVDTPGMHPPEGRPLSRYMNRVATGSLVGIDCVVLVITAEGWTADDAYPLQLVRAQDRPVSLAINKIDRLRRRAELLPLLRASAAKMDFAEIVPVSATKGTNIAELEQAIHQHLPEQPPIYPPDQLTDRGERFLATEIVREQVFRTCGDEVPYETAVKVDRFRRIKGVLYVEATILVEKEGQKAILIGKGGTRMKTIGQRARFAMEKLFGTRVHLALWVKVRRGWSDSSQAMRSLGYREDD